MATNLTPDEMNALVRQHFEDFVNKRNAGVIRRNMTADFYDHDGRAGKPTDVAGDEQNSMVLFSGASKGTKSPSGGRR